ncbi:MFS transporter [Abyssicoccus albus]|uniref:nitrate/nitrite transporter n=1 Tax=Abyssicoccus albus TaxID=1817405 RepID=UPI00097E20EF|nr:nitrate/nitrite transporter [Abyssicoccus albus]AQL56879.1 nitrate/nitrite transporter [Abyssicoccus albus]
MIKKLQLPLQTVNMVVGFICWVIISPLIPFISEDVSIPPDKLALITAIPVILGSVLRIPIGYFANMIGARWVFMISFVLLLFPVFYISNAATYIDLMIGGLFLGIGGAVFSIGVTSLPKYYPKEKHGLVNGIYGVGNIGTAVASFSAPVIATQIGWQNTVRLLLVLLLIFIALNFFFGDRHEKLVKQPLMKQIKGVIGNEKLWVFSLWYFITFGVFVAFTVFLPNFLTNMYELSATDAGMRTAGFIALATFIRPVGGYLGDKFNALICLILVFLGITAGAIILAFNPPFWLFTVGCLVVAASAGIGNGLVFKLVPQYFNKQAGIVNGIVSMMGGLGGFFPPLILATVMGMTGHYAIGFMLLSQLALASLILAGWMYYTDQLAVSKEVFSSMGQGILVTDLTGKITDVNPRFTEITGYSEDEVIGKNPSILQSGEQDKAYYINMWDMLKEQGIWQGEIKNKKKDGSIYTEWLNIKAVYNKEGEVERYVGTFSEIDSSIQTNG